MVRIRVRVGLQSVSTGVSVFVSRARVRRGYEEGMKRGKNGV